MNDRIPRAQRGPVLVGVKAKPSGWPTASLDPPLRARPKGDERDAGLHTKSQISGLYGSRGLPGSSHSRG